MNGLRVRLGLGLGREVTLDLRRCSGDKVVVIRRTGIRRFLMEAMAMATRLGLSSGWLSLGRMECSNNLRGFELFYLSFLGC